MEEIVAIKMVISNGLIEDCKQGIIITKQDDNMSFDALNLLPHDQLTLTAITLHQLIQEHLGEDSLDEEIDLLMVSLVHFIKALLDPTYKRENKGDVLQ